MWSTKPQQNYICGNTNSKKMSFLRDFSLEHQHFNIPEQFYLFIIILKGNYRLKLYIQSLM